MGMESPKGIKKPISPEHQRKLKMLGSRIKTLRIEKGYTSHEAFATKHGFNRTQYFRYENGEDLRFSSLLRIVSAFDMSLEEFFREL
jgi:transcriptional regulator with XRE-family HTH domain